MNVFNTGALNLFIRVVYLGHSFEFIFDILFMDVSCIYLFLLYFNILIWLLGKFIWEFVVMSFK